MGGKPIRREPRMADNNQCPDCGAELPASGLCTRCVLNVGLDDRNLCVRCPHCHNPVEILDDSSLREIPCSNCGSSFSLVTDETVSYQSQESNRLGHFELVEMLGVGAFGSVWKAKDSQLDRTVAIKIPRKEQLSERDVEQFFREHGRPLS